MSNQVFLDTGYVLALELANDQYHLDAQRHWTQVTAALPLLITTSYVFDEVVTYFNVRETALPEARRGACPVDKEGRR